MKAIIFDMDGVIIDSEPLHIKLEGELLEELGGTFNRKKHNSLVGTTDHSMWSLFKEKFNLEPTVEEMVDIKRQRFIDNIHQISLVSNFNKLINSLHKEKYPMALASSNNRGAVNAIIKEFNLNKYLTVSITGDEVDRGKPDPEIFLTAAEKLNVQPERCLVFEDANNGVAAAKAANMKCIGLQNPNSGDQDLSKADLVIDDFSELDLDIIKNLFE